MQIQADVYEDVEGILKFVSSIVVNFCDKLDDKDTPWHPIMEAMGIDKCPINKVKKNLKGFKQRNKLN